MRFFLFGDVLDFTFEIILSISSDFSYLLDTVFVSSLVRNPTEPPRCRANSFTANAYLGKRNLVSSHRTKLLKAKINF